MQKMKGAPGLIAMGAMTLVSLILLGFTSYRTVHFIQQTLPAESWLLAFFALGAFDIGLLGWIALHTWNASGSEQRSISITMIWVDIAGVAITFLADSYIQSGINGLTGKLDSAWTFVALSATGLVILANVVAFVFYHLCSPARKKMQSEEKLRSQIEERANQMVEEQNEILAAQLAPLMTQDRMKRLSAQYTATLGYMPRGLPSAGSARQVAPAVNKKAKPKLRVADSVRSAGNMRLVEDKPRRAAQPIYNPQFQNGAELENVEDAAEILVQSLLDDEEGTAIAHNRTEIVEDLAETEMDEPDFLSQTGMEEVEAAREPSQQIPVYHNGTRLQSQQQQRRRR